MDSSEHPHTENIKLDYLIGIPANIYIWKFEEQNIYKCTEQLLNEQVMPPRQRFKESWKCAGFVLVLYIQAIDALIMHTHQLPIETTISSRYTQALYFL